MWIKFDPKNSDMEEAACVYDGVQYLFTNGVGRQVPDDMGAHLLAVAADKYRETVPPTGPAPKPTPPAAAPATAPAAAPATPPAAAASGSN